MFDKINMTDSARRVVNMAGGLALVFKDAKVGTQHLLLALVGAEEGSSHRPALSARMLQACNVSSKEVDEMMGSPVVYGSFSPGQLEPLNPSPEVEDPFGRAIDHSVSEAKVSFTVNGIVDTEHLLIGVALEPNGPAGRFLADRNADYVTLRQLRKRLSSLAAVAV